MMLPQALLTRLLDWCTQNCILIDPRIQIRSDENRGIHVLSTGALIPSDTTLVYIPKDVVLSVKSCSFSEYIPFERYGLGAQLGLSFALYSEILRGESSRWYGYLRSVSDVDLPVFWGCDTSSPRPSLVVSDIDTDEPLTWLRGTEVLKRLDERDTTNNNRTLLEHINHYYREVVLPILQRHDLRFPLAHIPDLAGFQRAYSLVSSRAFLVDVYHGLSMVPIADAFNHVLENHVHLQSDFYVCPACGSLKECEHDYEDRDRLGQAQNSQWKAGDHDFCYEMVSNTNIPPHEEVFNTYGEKLSNAQLLVQYGFILDPNDNDVLNFDVDEIHRAIPSSWDVPVFVVPGYEEEEEELDSVSGLAGGSDLIFVHAPAEPGSRFCINSDGKVSHQLWMTFVALVCQQTGSWSPSRGLQEEEEGRRSMIKLQLALEHVAEEDESRDQDESVIGGADELKLPQARVLLEVARMIVRLCGARKETIGPPGSSGRDLGYVLDAVPEGKKRMRLALSVVVNEQSILDSCRFNWMDFVSVFGMGDA